jgi:biotin-(acetyl-CoA carboxylase) ligase
MSDEPISESAANLNILKLSVIDSTNLFAKERFNELMDRTAVVADSQTAGRGRGGRSWYCPLRGNLFRTLVLKPNLPFSKILGSPPWP